jgi:hypothetical protein
VIAALLEQGTLAYSVQGQPRIERAFRTWALEDGKPLTIVTELHDDEGMSIENAAEQVRAVVEARWGSGCRIIQHFPWSSIVYAEQGYRNGRMAWWYMKDEDLRALLGPSLDETAPDAGSAPSREEP